MKKIVIVCCFDTFFARVRLLKEYYEANGYNTIVICSDFKHIHKEYESEKVNEYTYIHANAYKKNLSIKRLYSHFKFAKDVFKHIEEIKPDALHVIIPANSLAKFAAKYKRHNSNVKLFFDVNDLWPETLPIPFLKNSAALKPWKNLREKNLEFADKIFCECKLFYKKMNKKDIDKYQTLLWSTGEEIINSFPDIQESEVKLCYLGSINNLIDINMITKLIESISKYKPCTLHIIGDGIKKTELINSIKNVGAKIVDHGIVYDKKEKQTIFDTVHYGLNIMKPSVCVGLTMKSLDYFAGQLPIINTIVEDTTDLVDHYKLGFNVNLNNVEETVLSICNTSVRENFEMRENVKSVYLTYFTKEAFYQSLRNS